MLFCEAQPQSPVAQGTAPGNASSGISASRYGAKIPKRKPPNTSANMALAVREGEISRSCQRWRSWRIPMWAWKSSLSTFPLASGSRAGEGRWDCLLSALYPLEKQSPTCQLCARLSFFSKRGRGMEGA